MQIIEDELAKIFEPVEMLPYIKVKKVITNDGEKIVVIGKGDLDKCIPIITEIEDKRIIKEQPYDKNWWATTGYTTTGWSTSISDSTEHTENATFSTTSDIDTITVTASIGC